MPEHFPGGTARPPCPAPGSGAQPGDPDDEILAAVLIRMWALASGRTLRRDVLPCQLGEEELIAFWADDMTEPTGRHALPQRTGIPVGSGDLDRASRTAAKPRRRRRRRSGGNAARTRQAIHPGTSAP
jgi:hypothetical protein